MVTVLGVLVACGPSPDRWPPAIAETLARDETSALVLVFAVADCPVLQRSSPELVRLEERFAAAGVEWAIVHAGPDGADPDPDLARGWGLDVPVLGDPDLELAHRLGVTVASETAVLDPGGRLVYRGRIDDRAAALGRSRPVPRVHDLERALEAVVAGREVAVARTTAVGCFLDPLGPHRDESP